MKHILSMRMFHVRSSLALNMRFLNEQDRWILWIPVFWGIGMAWGLTANHAVPFVILVFAGVLSFLCGCAVVLKRNHLAILIVGHIGLGCLGGFFWSTLYVDYLYRTPLLTQETRPLWLSGRIQHAEQRPYGYRILMDHLLLPRDVTLTERAIRPHHHVALVFKQGLSLLEKNTLQPGALIRVLCVLIPWSGPNIPGGYHPARSAAWGGCIAHGYGLDKPRVTQLGRIHPGTIWRHRLNQWLGTRMSPQALPIAQALVTGERGTMTQKVRDDFANTGLAHLLAISGLHMSLVMGIGFILGRRLFSLIAPVACRYDTKKWAVFPGIFLGGAYLILSGAAIPAQRAWMMGLMAFGAILMNREPLSMRALACAAWVILMMHPPALLNVSFQLSFAAVLGLVSFYEDTWMRTPSGRGVIIRYLQGALTTSAIATLATAPIIMMTFNRFTLHSILANLIAVPWTCFVIMPLGMLGLATSAWGFDITGLWYAWDQSLCMLRSLAAWMSTWPGSQILGATPSLSVQVLLIFGGIWLFLWKTSWRWWGGASIAIGIIAYVIAPKPFFLVDRTGKTLGFYRDGVLSMSSLRSRRLKHDWAQSLGTQHVQASSLKPYQPWMVQQDDLLIQHQMTDQGVWIWRVMPRACPEQSGFIIQSSDLQALGTHMVTAQGGPCIRTVYSSRKQRYWDL